MLWQRLKEHALSRAAYFSRNDVYFIAAMGILIALLFLPIFNNLGIPSLLRAHSISILWSAVAVIVVAPFGLLAGAYFLAILPFHRASAIQLSRYAVIGCFNVALNASIFNLFILVTGISTGPMVTLFAVITFIIVVTQSFFWSVFWTFRHVPSQNRTRQYMSFFAVSSAVNLINIAIIYFMTSILGAPQGIPNTAWANIALLVTIFSSLIGNFVGYKFFVFRA